MDKDAKGSFSINLVKCPSPSKDDLER